LPQNLRFSPQACGATLQSHQSCSAACKGNRPRSRDWLASKVSNDNLIAQASSSRPLPITSRSSRIITAFAEVWPFKVLRHDPVKRQAIAASSVIARFNRSSFRFGARKRRCSVKKQVGRCNLEEECARPAPSGPCAPDQQPKSTSPLTCMRVTQCTGSLGRLCHPPALRDSFCSWRLH
jgi:hypothetical protein